jgi:hypothetical protein
LCTLFNNQPLLNEPGVEKNHHDLLNYNEIISFANLDIAVCDILNKKEEICLSFFENYSDRSEENKVLYNFCQKFMRVVSKDFPANDFELRFEIFRFSEFLGIFVEKKEGAGNREPGFVRPPFQGSDYIFAARKEGF